MGYLNSFFAFNSKYGSSHKYRDYDLQVWITAISALWDVLNIPNEVKEIKVPNIQNSRNEH